VETHEKRVPLRAYLAANGSMDLGGGGPGKAKRPVAILAALPAANDDAPEPEARPPRFGR
jgi:hypothetical protein